MVAELRDEESLGHLPIGDSILGEAVDGAAGRVDLHCPLGVDLVPLDPGPEVPVRYGVLVAARPDARPAADAAGRVDQEPPFEVAQVVEIARWGEGGLSRGQCCQGSCVTLMAQILTSVITQRLSKTLWISLN